MFLNNRGLDNWIVENIFHWQRQPDGYGYLGEKGRRKYPPCYSSDWGAAGELLGYIVDKMPQEDVHLEHLEGTGWIFGSCYLDLEKWPEPVETGPLAITKGVKNFFDRGLL